MHWTIKISPGDDNSVLAEFNNFLTFDKMRYRTARWIYQRTPIEKRSTNANGEKEEEPQPHGFALLHGCVLADHWRYMSNVLNAWRIDIFRINGEKSRQEALAMRDTEETLKKSVLVMKGNEKRLQQDLQDIQTVQTDATKLQERAASINAHVAKMQRDITEAKLHGSSYF
jgi:hypothetical protein